MRCLVAAIWYLKTNLEAKALLPSRPELVHRVKESVWQDRLRRGSSHQDAPPVREAPMPESLQQPSLQPKEASGTRSLTRRRRVSEQRPKRPLKRVFGSDDEEKVPTGLRQEEVCSAKYLRLLSTCSIPTCSTQITETIVSTCMKLPIINPLSWQKACSLQVLNTLETPGC